MVETTKWSWLISPVIGWDVPPDMWWEGHYLKSTASV